MGAENLKPLDELKSLDQQVDLVTDLAALKPIFHRLDEIANQCPDDFEVQLVVGDIKQHLVNRGTRLKEQPGGVKPAAGAPPLPPTAAVPRSATPPPPVPPPISTPKGPPPMPEFRTPPEVTPPVRLMSSGQFAKPGEPAGPPPIPPMGAPPPRAPLSPQAPTVKLSSGVTPPPVQPPGQGLLNTGPQAPVFGTGPNVPPQMPPSGKAYAPPVQAGPKAPKVPPKVPSSPGSWQRPLLIGGLLGALVAIVIIAFLVNQARKKKPVVVATTMQVDVTTTPPNASIRINGDAKCTSPCKIDLDPGTYQVMAFLDGYDPATNSVTVVQGQAASVALTLAAQPQSVRILTDLDQGKIVLDDQPPADLQEGQFIIDKVAPGPHTVKLTGRAGDASFSFEIADAKPPVITGSVTARNLMAVLISSLGSQAHVVTSAGPMKLVVNGQPEGDAGPAGVDLKSFTPGVDELIVGDGKDQRNMKESFGPGPMLTAFLKSDLNIGTLIVSTGEDDVHVFVNDKENRRRTQRGQVRIPAIGSVTVRVAKDGFQTEPPQTAEVKKGAEVRMEFKLKPAATVQTSSLQIHGATPGAEVFLDQNSIGTVGADGNFARNNVSPGDHVIDLRRDQFTPKRVQRNFKAGQPVVLSGADVVLAAVPVNTSGTIHLSRTPADAAVTYHRADESQTHEVRGNLLELPAGSYVFTGKASGYSDKTERVQIAAGENRAVEITLTHVAPAPVKTGDMSDFEDPSAWKKEDDLWTHRGGGFVPYKLGPKGTYTFTVELVHGGNVFKGGRIRWCVQYVDAKNYLLYELDHKTFWAEVVDKGKKLEREKTQHKLESQKSFTIQIEVTAEHVLHRIKNASGQWVVLDTFAEPGRDFSAGKVGFLIQGNDEIGVSDFSYTPSK